MATTPAFLEGLDQYFVDVPSPLLTWETIQIVLYREILDFAVFRTEESRELNTVMTPASVDGDGLVERVAFLASKQKAVESRELENLLRTAANREGFDRPGECYLKDYLCLKCPRCALFGGTQVSAHDDDNVANIKHRIGYATAFSLAPFADVEQAITFNAVDEDTLRTGQALGTRNTVRPATLFASIVTLRSVTWKEFVLALKAILQARKYGAETRIGGGVRNTVVALNFGWEEALTPLELTLELSSATTDQLADPKWLAGMLAEYGKLGAMPARQTVVTGETLDGVLSGIREFELDREFLESAYADVQRFRDVQRSRTS